jgi:hypothetical protein
MMGAAGGSALVGDGCDEDDAFEEGVSIELGSSFLLLFFFPIMNVGGRGATFLN